MKFKKRFEKLMVANNPRLRRQKENEKKSFKILSRGGVSYTGPSSRAIRKSVSLLQRAAREAGTKSESGKLLPRIGYKSLPRILNGRICSVFSSRSPKETEELKKIRREMLEQRLAFMPSRKRKKHLKKMLRLNEKNKN